MSQSFQVKSMMQVGVFQTTTGKFILPIPSHGNDDCVHVSYYNHYAQNKFEFSSNIQIVDALTTGGAGGGFVIVEKINPNIMEKVKVRNPDTGGSVTVTF